MSVSVWAFLASLYEVICLCRKRIYGCVKGERVLVDTVKATVYTALLAGTVYPGQSN